MYRHLTRVFVAILTFTVGVMASWLFFRPAVRREVRTEVVAVASKIPDIDMGKIEPVSKVPSPMMSIESGPNQPIKFWYVGTETMGGSNDRLRVSFLIQNVSYQAIRSYLVTCGRPNESLRKLVELQSFERGFRFGASQPLVCECQKDDTLELRVLRVEFLNGDIWKNELTF